MTSDSPEKIAWFRSELVRCLHMLTSPVGTQIAHLRKIGEPGSDENLSADELALEFGDAFLCVQSRYEALEFEADLIVALERLDAKLAAMSGPHNPDLWTGRALRDHADWKDVRKRAARCLGLLGELK